MFLVVLVVPHVSYRSCPRELGALVETTVARSRAVMESTSIALRSPSCAHLGSFGEGGSTSRAEV